jgi:hypothetical protein
VDEPEPPGGIPERPDGVIRLVSWNAQGGLARKAHRLAALRPDVAVEPECGLAAGSPTFDWTPRDVSIAGPGSPLGRGRRPGSLTEAGARR